MQVDFLITGGSGVLGSSLRRRLPFISTTFTLNRDVLHNTYFIEEQQLSSKAVLLYASSLTPHNSTFTDQDLVTSRNLICNTLKYLRDKYLDLSLFYFSSVSVYRPDFRVIYDETSTVCFEKRYSAYKLYTEQLLKVLCSKYRYNLHILRLSAFLAQNSRNSIVSLASSLKSNQDIHVYNPGLPYNGCLSLESLIDIIYQYSAGTLRLPDCINIGSSSSMPMIDLINYLKQTLRSHSNIKISDIQRNSFTIDPSLAISLGVPIFSIEDNIECFLKYL